MNGEILRRSYDTFAPKYDEVFLEQQRPKILGLLAHVPPVAPALDLGCGTGLARRLTGRPLVGLDFSRGMLQCGEGPRVQADLHRTPFPAGAFALVLCVTALIDFVDPAPALAEVRRLLRPDGWLALSVLKREDVGRLEGAMAAAGLAVQVRLDLDPDLGYIARPA